MVSAEAGTSNEKCNGTENGGGPRNSSISILHFNDVYNVEEQSSEPVAGAARFKTALQSFKDKDPLILFSGDILAPSISKCGITINMSCILYNLLSF